MAGLGHRPPIRAGLTGFLWLWLLPIAILLLGFARAWATGQADPWDWTLPAASLLAAAGLVLAPHGGAALAWVAAGSVGTVLLFCARVALRAPDGLAALGLLATAGLALSGGAMLRRAGWRRAAGAVLLVLAACLPWLGPPGSLRAVRQRPALAVITALPLFWEEAGRAGPGQLGTGPLDAPIITVLRTRFAVQPLDDPAALAASGARSLLLAQPRAMTPAQLAAIDHWVRAGGTALVLADPMLRWPSGLPLGDRRRPPAVDLLHPLLIHWGFAPSGPVEGKEIRHFMPDGRLITLSGAQRWAPGAVPAVRPVGAGRVLLLGDADVVDDRLWLADPARPLDPRAWVADTPALLAAWLGAPIPGGRRWMREAGDVLAGLRWALLAGTGWAIMGTGLLRRFSAAFPARAGPGKNGAKPGEND